MGARETLSPEKNVAASPLLVASALKTQTCFLA